MTLHRYNASSACACVLNLCLGLHGITHCDMRVRVQAIGRYLWVRLPQPSNASRRVLKVLTLCEVQIYGRPTAATSSAVLLPPPQPTAAPPVAAPSVVHATIATQSLSNAANVQLSADTSLQTVAPVPNLVPTLPAVPLPAPATTTHHPTHTHVPQQSSNACAGPTVCSPNARCIPVTGLGLEEAYSCVCGPYVLLTSRSAAALGANFLVCSDVAWLAITWAMGSGVCPGDCSQPSAACC